MRAASIQEIKQELGPLKPAQLMELCLKLARFKKDNKELLTYLLFEASDEENYVREIKEEIGELMAGVNLSQLYFAKKSFRKVGRLITKYARYSPVKTTEVELRVHFLKEIGKTGVSIKRNAVIHNLYLGQLKKVHALIEGLHEDLQYEYRREVDALEL